MIKRALPALILLILLVGPFAVIDYLFCRSINAEAETVQDPCVFRVEFYNDTDKQLEVFLDWASHSFPEHPWPFNVAGGEIAPGETWPLQDDYLCGDYFIRWMFGDITYIYGFRQKSYHDKVRVFTPPEEWHDNAQ